MLQELIYTRCRYGVDIKNKGQEMQGDGMKIYSCSPSVYQDPNACPIGLDFLRQLMERKPPFKDPDHMDDAYFYLKPDGMKGMLMDSFPIRYNPHASVDYSNRSGNYINQLLIGDFSSFYPYETFGDSRTWDAKGKGEAYYYHNLPHQSPGRVDITPAGRYDQVDLCRFIADGREDALRKAVAFLLSQYDPEVPPENRRYLVINDDSAEHLELWVAAIEAAFSPRMASGLPFATRMTENVFDNRYTVDQRGVYCTSINLQDPKQKIRYRAMVVGVDTRLSGDVRAKQDSPFVVLNGITKQAQFDADTRHPYYSFITRLDDNQTYFCREFLQTFGIFQPDKAILSLYDFYVKLSDANRVTAADLVSFFTLIGSYRMTRTQALLQIYKQASQYIDDYFRHDPVNAITIMDWIIRNCALANDQYAATNLKQKLYFSFGEALFRHNSGVDVPAFWQGIKNRGYTLEIAKYLTNTTVIKHYQNEIRQLSAAEVLELFRVQLACNEALEHRELDVLKYFCKICIIVFARNSRIDLLKELADNLNQRIRQDPYTLLLKASQDENRETREFVILYLVKQDSNVVSSVKSVGEFCNQLREFGMADKIPQVAKRFIKQYNGFQALENIARNLAENHSLTQQDLGEFYKEIDNEIKMALRSRNGFTYARQEQDLADFLQQQRDGTKLSLPGSAHLCALEKLKKNKSPCSLQNLIGPYVQQMFPSVRNDGMIKEVCDKFLRPIYDSPENYEYIAMVLLDRPEDYLEEYLYQLVAAENPGAVGLFSAKSTSIRFINTISFYDSLYQRSREHYDMALRALAKALEKARTSNRTAERLEASLVYGAQFFSEAYRRAFPQGDRGHFDKLIPFGGKGNNGGSFRR